MPRSAVTKRFNIRDQHAAIVLDGSTSFLAKASPTGINNGTNGSITVAGWVKLSSNALGTFAELHVNGGTSPSFGVGLSGGSYFLFSDRVNGVNNKTITQATFDTYIGVNRWIMLTYVLTSTNITVYAGETAILPTSALGTAINAGTISNIFIGKGQTVGQVDIQFLAGKIRGFRFYNGALTAQQVSDLYYSQINASSIVAAYGMDDGAGSVVADSVGSNSMTATGITWTSDVPFSARKQIGGSLVKNSSFEYAPPFTAATTTTARWIDGTSGGSLTNNLFGWAASGLVASVAMSFDSTVSYNPGGKSIKISALDATGRGSVSTSLSTATPTDKNVLIRVLPSTSYTYTVRCKTSNVPTNCSYSFVREYDEALSLLATNNTNKLSGTNDWTLLTVTFTTSATTTYAAVALTCTVAGNTYDAWFDEVNLVATSGQTRVAIPLSVSAATATGTITVLDYTIADGVNATGSTTITDYTLMAGGNFNVLSGMGTITEGALADFVAETSNEVTATNVAAAMNAAFGPGIATAVGAVITFSIPGQYDGGTFVWSGTGVTPATATCTGGFDNIQLTVGAASTTIGGGGISIGASNNDLATNIAAWISGLGTPVGTATAVGPVVTIPASSTGAAGNSIALSQVGFHGASIGSALTLSGATLTGGVDGAYGRVLIT